MTSQFLTRRDVIRYAAGRVTFTVAATGATTAAVVTMHLGTDPDATVRVGQVIAFSILVSVAVSMVLSAALSYRSAILMRELTKTRRELLRISRTDQLTGLLNRRGFDDEAGVTLALAQQQDQQVVALMCDIDRFKSINDRFGHEFGDRVLVAIGDILREFSDVSDILIARHGGEEFAALMVGVSNEQAMLYAETLRRLCSTEVSENGTSTPVTVSIGITSPQRKTDLSTIMRFADQALYQAKDNGRNCVVQINAMPVAVAAEAA
ncbi:MAG: GGDEF domain-containing protein [Rhodopseudomonas sp.]|uniref:GGDEF domain-containing protein n=1 Tax=Rhodopseudomonas sp. TaxID=1078 RepID=UPI00185417C9|nr:GGDEF domain-containing protein [Rhodopseudomonas sp.]NVN87105.1 GGDEF domain-containing protein [Rhodopseudomonas sp.]